MPQKETALLEIEIVSDFRQGGLDFRQGGLNFKHGRLDFQQVGKCLSEFVTSDGQDWVGLALLYHYLGMIILISKSMVTAQILVLHET